MRATIGSIIFFTLVFAGLAIAFGFWFTVGQNERGVLTRWGAIIKDNIEPGLHFKTPFMDGAHVISVATHKSVYEDMEAYSSDQQPADFKISVNWHVPADRVGEVYWRYGGEQGIVDTVLDRHVPQQSKNVFGRYNAITLIRDRTNVNKEVFDTLFRSVKGLPIVIESVQIEDVKFSPDYIAAIKARMIAEVEVEKLRQKEAQQKVNAEILVINATAEAEAKVKQAEAEARAIELNGKAVADALALKGKALVENPQLVDMAIAEKWSGVLPQQMLPSGTLPLIDLTPRQLPGGAQ